MKDLWEKIWEFLMVLVTVKPSKLTITACMASDRCKKKMIKAQNCDWTQASKVFF